MLGTASFMCVASGAATAYLAKRFPVRTKALEMTAGILLIGGLALLGWAISQTARFY
jgi:hypothetical protein